MTVTAVPLQPVKRSYLAWLWIAIAVLVAGAFLLARQGDFYRTTPSGLKFHQLTPGSGATPSDTDLVAITYVGRLPSGEVFERNDQPQPMQVKDFVPGFSEGLKMMRNGSRYRFLIPASLAYGAQEKRDPTGKVVIPANSPLVFDVQMLGFLSVEKYQQLMMQQQMMRGMGGQGGPGGAPGGPGGAPGEQAAPPPGPGQ